MNLCWNFKRNPWTAEGVFGVISWGILVVFSKGSQAIFLNIFFKKLGPEVIREETSGRIAVEISSGVFKRILEGISEAIQWQFLKKSKTGFSEKKTIEKYLKNLLGTSGGSPNRISWYVYLKILQKSLCIIPQLISEEIVEGISGEPNWWTSLNISGWISWEIWNDFCWKC